MFGISHSGNNQVVLVAEEESKVLTNKVLDIMKKNKRDEPHCILKYTNDKTNVEAKAYIIAWGVLLPAFTFAYTLLDPNMSLAGRGLITIIPTSLFVATDMLLAYKSPEKMARPGAGLGLYAGVCDIQKVVGDFAEIIEKSNLNRTELILKLRDYHNFRIAVTRKNADDIIFPEDIVINIGNQIFGFTK